MLAAAWLMLSSLLYSLQINTGSFPKPLTPAEEQYYLQRSAEGDLDARNILIERNLRLVAHIMNNGYSKRKPLADALAGKNLRKRHHIPISYGVFSQLL